MPRVQRRSQRAKHGSSLLRGIFIQMEWLRIIRGSEGLDLTRIQRLEMLANPEVLQKSLCWPPSVLDVMDCSESYLTVCSVRARLRHNRGLS